MISLWSILGLIARTRDKLRRMFAHPLGWINSQVEKGYFSTNGNFTGKSAGPKTKQKFGRTNTRNPEARPA